MRRRGQGAGAIGEGSYTVDLARTAVENFVPDGETIFNIPAPAGINILFLRIRHLRAARDFWTPGTARFYSQKEQAEAKRVMICCAGCKTDRAMLDL